MNTTNQLKWKWWLRSGKYGKMQVSKNQKIENQIKYLYIHHKSLKYYEN